MANLHSSYTNDSNDENNIQKEFEKNLQTQLESIKKIQEQDRFDRYKYGDRRSSPEAKKESARPSDRFAKIRQQLMEELKK